MAPKRFKSAYMFYSAEQHRMIRDNAADKKVRRFAILLRNTASQYCVAISKFLSHENAISICRSDRLILPK